MVRAEWNAAPGGWEPQPHRTAPHRTALVAGAPLTWIKRAPGPCAYQAAMVARPRSLRPPDERGRRPLPVPLPLFLLDPVLGRILRRVTAAHPDPFDRLGAHRHEHFLIDPVDLPFMLHLRADPEAPDFRAVDRRRVPPHVARISGTFLDLLMLMDTEQDGDALFFSRDLVVTGNTEAVVCLRNALDDVEEPIAEQVADLFGPAGWLALNRLRRAAAAAQERKRSRT
jgi:predicted lipid carrier protein YhbT